MLRKIRLFLGILSFSLLTLLFLDFTGVIHAWFGWLAKIQFVPAVLAHSLVIVGFLIILTLLFGRIYCSVICPLGVMQDGISWTAGKVRKKRRFSYRPAISWLRWLLLAVFVIALAAGITSVFTVLDPYGAYGRIASNLFAPLYQWGNNALAYISERTGGYALYPVEVWIRNWVAFAVAVATLLIVGFLAWRNGRTYCNTICPVGTFLGIFSRFSLFKPLIDSGKCTKCSQCSRACKASCIDYKNYKIDHSRCVACMNCLGSCKFDALHYTMRKQVGKAEATTAGNPDAAGEEPGTGKKGMSRRSFLAVSGTFAVTATVKAQLPVIDGGLAVIEDKKPPRRDVPVVPPGALGARHIKQHCSACQLCVSACPNGILVPSGKLDTFMQPQMSFERGYCRPECVKCSEVCPNRAITRIDTAEKSSIQIGRAVWIRENCIVNRDERTCTACERHCPTGAIELVPGEAGNPDSLKIPVVDTETCIGCGACEYLCPARPFSAIYVEGNHTHRTI